MLFRSFKRNVLAQTRAFGAPDCNAIAGFNDTQLELKEMVSKWSIDTLQPIASKIDKEDKFDRKIWNQMGELGLLGITVPE